MIREVTRHSRSNHCTNLNKMLNKEMLVYYIYVYVASVDAFIKCKRQESEKQPDYHRAGLS